MINNRLGFTVESRRIEKTRIVQFIQNPIVSFKTVTQCSSGQPITIVKHHNRTGTGSALTIGNRDAYYNSQSSLQVGTVPQGYWVATRGQSFNNCDKRSRNTYSNTSIPTDQSFKTPRRSPYVPSQNGSHNRLQQHKMGGSCISKHSSKVRPPPKPNKIEQPLQPQQPVVLYVQSPKKTGIDLALLDSDDEAEDAEPQQLQKRVPSDQKSSERLASLMDKINLGYYPFSEDSYNRHLQKILEYVRLVQFIDWQAELQSLHQVPLSQQFAKSLQLHQQLFKWCAYAGILTLLCLPEQELFHQDLNLQKDIAQLLKKNIRTENMKVKWKEQKPGWYHITNQLKKGVQVHGILFRTVELSQYELAVKRMMAQHKKNVKHWEQFTSFEMLCIVGGIHFHIQSVYKPKIKVNSKKQQNCLIQCCVPETIEQPIRFNAISEPTDRKLKDVADNCQPYRFSYGGLHCLLLSKSKQGKINERATSMCQFLKGNETFYEDVSCIIRKRVKKPKKQAIQQFSQIKHNLTHTMVEQFCLLNDLLIFDLIQHCNRKQIRQIVMTQAVVQAMKYVISSADQDVLYDAIKQLLTFQVTPFKQKIHIYLTLQLIYASGSQISKTLEQIINSPHVYPIQFFDAIHNAYAVDIDSIFLKIKKDATYLIYNISEFKPMNLNLNMIVKEPFTLRDIVIILMKNLKGAPLLVDNKHILFNGHNLPNLTGIDQWCQDTERTLGSLKTVNGQQCNILIPFIIKLAVETVLKTPNQQTYKKVEKIYNSLAFCTPQITISVMSILALACQAFDKAMSQQYYIRAITILHRTYSQPRARNNTHHPWEVFLIARLLNMKKIASRDLEVEYLADLMECMVAEHITQNPFEFPDKFRQAYPFPTLLQHYSQPFQTSSHALLQWMIDHMPIGQHSHRLYKKTDISKNDLNRSNMSTQSRSTSSRKQKSLTECIQKNEATIDKDNYSGALILGNLKRNVLVYWPLKNLMVHKVSCGISHCVASTLDAVFGWGDNESKQIGPEPGNHLRKICSISAPVTKISCGTEHSCILLNGQLKMWGQKEGGIISGDGYTFDDIECGGLHSVALKDGQVYSWGRGEGGQLGHPLNCLETKQGAESTEYFLSKPRKIKSLSRIKKIACGDAHTLALDEDGRVFVFGFSYQGQLGLGLTGDSETFQIFQPLKMEFFNRTRIIDVAAGSTFSIFVTERKQVFSCGLNDFHQIGIDKTVTVVQKRRDKKPQKFRKQRQGQLEFSIPNKLDYFSDCFDIRRIICGQNHTIAEVEYNSQQLYIGWGMNKYQQLGLEYCVSTTPRTISNIQRVAITEICCGSTFTIALTGQMGDRISLRKLIMDYSKGFSDWAFQPL